MHQEAREELRVRLKLVVLELASHLGVTKACREFDVSRSSFYRWRQKYEKAGRSGLYRERPVAYRHPRRTYPGVVEKILAIRTEYQLGALLIWYYLDRYHGIKISESAVSRVLKAHRVNRLPKTASRRALHTKRYAKTVPGHYTQVDVKFVRLKVGEGKTVKQFQYTSIDDATRIRALQIRSFRNITKIVQSSSWTTLSKSFPSGSARFEPTELMSFKLVFIGISISSPKHPS